MNKKTKKVYPAEILLNPLRLTDAQAAWLRKQPNMQAALRQLIDDAITLDEVYGEPDDNRAHSPQS